MLPSYRFGLSHVNTTSIASSYREPLKEVGKSTHNKFSLRTSNKLTKTNDQSNKQSNVSATLPHTKKGFNGMGGQSKILYIPKRTTGLKKPTVLKNESKTLKIRRNNNTISKFLAKPLSKIPSIELSP